MEGTDPGVGNPGPWPAARPRKGPSALSSSPRNSIGGRGSQGGGAPSSRQRYPGGGSASVSSIGRTEA